jgi:hypothetical protein
MSGRRNVSFRWAALAAGCAAWAAIGSVAVADRAPGERVSETSTAPNPAVALGETVRELLARRDADALARLVTGLVEDSPVGMRVAIARSLSEAPPVPMELAPALASAVASASAEDLPAVLSAARWTGDRAVVGAVVELLRREGSGVRASAMATLRVQTGDAVTSDDPAAWTDWWNRARGGTDGAWWRMIATNQRVSNHALSTRLASLDQRLRRLFLEAQARLSEEQRAAFVSDLLGSPDPRDQALGLDFAERALLNARALGVSEVRGAATILSSENVELRGRAAALLDRSDPPSIGPEVRAALRAETTPEVAASLLRLVGRRGWCDAEQDVLRWLRRGPGPAYAAGLDAGAALLESGCFRTPEDRDELAQHAMAMVLSPGLAHASPAVARICGSLGVTWALRQLLASPIEEVARIAAESLTSDAGSVDLIVSAARTRATLFGAAALALSHHRPTVGGVATLVSLPAEEAALAQGIGTLARALAPEELVRALGTLESPDLRIAAIEPVLTAAPPEAPAAEVWTRLRVALADALIELGRPEAALTILESDAMPSDASASRRCMVLVWLGRLDDALTVPGAGVADWMAGLERSAQSPHAREAVRLMEDVFAGDITDEMRTRIASLLGPADVEE